MTETGYLIIAISILAALLVLFFVTFVLYIRTPVPKGCEDLEMNDHNCSICGHTECSHYVGKKEEE